MAKPKLLITGCRGQLGSDLLKAFADRYMIWGVDIEDFDIGDADAVNDALYSFSPDIILHAAAYTNVDDCESNPKLAMHINTDGTKYIAAACKKIGAKLIYYSTDYVFSGDTDTPYVETDTPAPKTVYGKSKLAGEQHVAEILEDYLILRLAWVYGAKGKNFVRTMIKLGWEQEKTARDGGIITPLKVVNDQTGNPTWTWEIVRQTQLVLEKNLTGICHCTSQGEATWYEFAKAIFDTLNMHVQIKPCTTEEYPRPAPRPKYSVLKNKRLQDAGIDIMKHYREALTEFLTKQKEELLPCNAT